MNLYEDFYDEPSEFELQIADFKSALADAVRADIKEKIERLEKENEELREYRNLKEEHERILRNKVAEYDRAILQAKSDTRRASLKTIFGENLITAYRAHCERMKFKKCDRCDDKRQIAYKTPLGHDAYEDCACKQVFWGYTPKEVRLVSFYASADSIANHRHTNLYYERTQQDRDYDRYDLCGEVYNGEDFEKANSYRAVFFDLEKCTEYCEWLNQRANKEIRDYAEEWGLILEQESMDDRT